MPSFEVRYARRTITDSQTEKKYKLVFKGHFIQGGSSSSLDDASTGSQVDVKIELVITNDIAYEHFLQEVNVREFGDRLPVTLGKNAQARLDLLFVPQSTQSQPSEEEE